ncbi:MAG: DNA gyrase inhibitor YacG [Fluviibacter sp.]
MSTTVPCPHCGEAALFAPENKYRPFCSERCKMIDLGAWATESYRIPVADPMDGLEAGGDSHTDHGHN